MSIFGSRRGPRENAVDVARPRLQRLLRMAGVAGLALALAGPGICGPTAKSTQDAAAAGGQTTLARLSGRWVRDRVAQNKANRKEGRPAEPRAGVKITFLPGKVVEESRGVVATSAMYLSNDTIWDGELCRGQAFDAAAFEARHQDANGTVLLTFEDGDTVCRTIEKLTKRKLVLSYVGARLNHHYFKRPKQPAAKTR